MDETEVQIEIACWAQEHPEAWNISWKNGNEPWVSFPGTANRRSTLHLGLGGLTWTIALPSGYHTKIDPGDDKRKRLWEPLEYQDQVILQSRSSPFQVSVEDHSNNVLDFSFGLDRDFARKASLQLVHIDDSEKEQAQKLVDDMLQSLQLQAQSKENVDALSTSGSSEETRKSLIISNACFKALQTAETLGDVLDAIHGLAKLYNLHLHRPPVLGSKGPGTVGSGAASHPVEGDVWEDEDEDDDHMFATEIAIKWSWIAAQVDYASAACQESYKAFGGEARQPQGSSADLLESRAGLAEILSPNGPPKSDLSEEESVLVSSTPDSTERHLQLLRVHDRHDVNAAANEFEDLHCNSDTGDASSDTSWEIADFSDFESAPVPEVIHAVDNFHGSSEAGSDLLRSSAKQHKRKFQQIMYSSTASEQTGASRSLEASAVSSLAHGQSRAGDQVDAQLQWCSISFNPQSFSVECTLRLREFLDNHTAATALGFALEHPLRVEIVPNKVEVDSLSWTGAVDVYVSQQSDWHNHVSEEICGLLCWVPYIVKSYFEAQVPAVLRERSSASESRGELFTGILQTLVKRLVKLNAGGSCIVCTKPGSRPSYLYMRERVVWACEDVSMCQATIVAWQEVSSVDPVEREREENSSLRLMEETVRNDFSYDGRDLLKAALEVYNVNTDNMNYGQMIRALARIELWNQKDPDTPESELLFQ